MNFVYPTAAEMNVILPDLDSRQRAGRVGLDLFPVRTRNTFMVRWAQKDNYWGLQQMRGLDGQPPKVQRTGYQTFVYEPGVYGEHDSITEREILTRAAPGRPDQTIDLTDIMMELDDLLLAREYDRMEYNVWTLLATGTLSIPLPGPAGVTVYKDTYTIQTYTAPVPWATSATATPLANIQTVQQLSVGHGASFGADATLYMNQVTANRLLNNTNSADYAGRRDQFGATLNNIGAFNNYFQGQNLPKIVIYDRGFQNQPLSGPITNAAAQFTKFIPDGVAILVGTRPNGAPIGEVQQTANALNPNLAAGPYRFVKDYGQGINAPKEVPPHVEVHRGWNGGLTIYYPSAVVALSV